MFRLALNQNTTLPYTRDIPKTQRFRKANVGKVLKDIYKKFLVCYLNSYQNA